MRKFYFENLDVWQKGRLLIREIYRLTGTFPADERFGITQQMRRSAVSVNCNIAEGNSRQSGKDQARFTEIAYGSLLETLNLLITSNDLGFLSEDAVQEIRPLIEELGNKLNALRETQLKR